MGIPLVRSGYEGRSRNPSGPFSVRKTGYDLGMDPVQEARIRAIIADRQQYERAKENLLTPLPEEIVEQPKVRARQVFLSLAEEIRREGDAMIEKGNNDAKELW